MGLYRVYRELFGNGQQPLQTIKKFQSFESKVSELARESGAGGGDGVRLGGSIGLRAGVASEAVSEFGVPAEITGLAGAGVEASSSAVSPESLSAGAFSSSS